MDGDVVYNSIFSNFFDSLVNNGVTGYDIGKGSGGMRWIKKKKKKKFYDKRWEDRRKWLDWFHKHNDTDKINILARKFCDLCDDLTWEAEKDE